MARSGAARKLRAVKDDEEEYLGQVKDFVDHLPDKYIHCRSRQHAWTDHTVTQYNNAYVVTWRCTRCGARKSFHVDSRGMLLGSTQYEHPEGYLLKGLGNIRGEGRGIVRLASITKGKRVIVVNEDLE